MKFFFTILFISCVNIIFCADHYNPGDTLYVWAKGGLELRTSYSIKSAIIRKVAFREPVIVLEKTNVPYETALIQGLWHEDPDLNIDPFICHGHWVKVKLISGESGYVVDPYVLAINPDRLYKSGDDEYTMQVISIDTTWVNPKNSVTSDPLFCLQMFHAYGIYSEECFGGSDDKRIYVFPGMTTEEALIFFAYERENYSEAMMTNYHHDGVRLSINEYCNWTVSTTATETRIKEECAF